MSPSLDAKSVRVAMAVNGLSQAEVGRKLGVSRACVNQWIRKIENGQLLSEHAAGQLAKALETPVSDLLAQAGKENG